MERNEAKEVRLIFDEMTDFRVNKLFVFKGKCGKNNCDNSGDNVVVQQVQQEGNGFQFIFIPGNNEATTTTTCATTTEIESTTAGSLFFNVLEDDIIQ
jgi:hypothetical protein